jgi:nitrite reductase/ring-hydroxylating ferredoxin subunit
VSGFVHVGSAGEFEDGRVRAFRIDGRDVAVVRRGARFFAFENACTHSAFTFTGLRLQDDGTLVCASHFARFDVANGNVLDGPAGRDLTLYAIRVADGDVFVLLQPDTGPEPWNAAG